MSKPRGQRLPRRFFAFGSKLPATSGNAGGCLDSYIEELKMKIWTFFVLCLCVASLCACVSPMQQRQAWVIKCQDYGFKPSTPEMAQCLMTQDMAQQQQEREDFDHDMDNASQSFGRAADSWRAIAQTSARTNCRVRGYNSNQISCRSY